MRRLSVLLLALAAIGCSRQQDVEVPAACRAGTDSFLRALRSAPADVRLDGSQSISGCFKPEVAAEGVQELGGALVSTATRLTDDRNVVQLGYLVGAARKGAESKSGIYDEIVRRLNQEAAPVADRTDFIIGERAGRTSG